MIRVKGRDREVYIVHRQVGEFATFALVQELAQDGSVVSEAYYREDFLEADTPEELAQVLAAVPVVKV